MGALHEESFIVQEMEKAFRDNSLLDYQLFYSCHKICELYGLEQLSHAKGVLEQRMAYDDSLRILMTLAVSVIAVLLSAFSIMGLSTNIMVGAFVLFIFSVLCYCFILINTNEYRKSMYFLSVICDEISKRSK
ncbi:MAG: hypothetical protein J5979_03880 [Lachnospiraceae bacterium]|nr:hypothetical protein [Lachnospiraceae bacterium]